MFTGVDFVIVKFWFFGLGGGEVKYHLLEKLWPANVSNKINASTKEYIQKTDI